MALTLFDKIWNAHIVESIPDGPDVLYIDRHFIHEVTSPQAFSGLERRGLSVYRPDKVIATPDHNVPTINQDKEIKDKLSRLQVDRLRENCSRYRITMYDLNHPYHGIVHIIGPELGITQPGQTIVCGDSHTATHGAFGTIAFGIGTSEVEMVLATQCLLQYRPQKMRIVIDGTLQRGVVSKDIILYIISKLTAAGGTGYFIEYAGDTISQLSMESRMTICNMSIEMGARGGLIAPDEITYSYIKGKTYAPKGEDYKKSVETWRLLFSDPDAVLDKEYRFRAEEIDPMITYGTNPGMGISINGTIPSVAGEEKPLQYMGLHPGDKLQGKKINYVFIGSCTNGRIEDFRLVAGVIKGHKKAEHVRAFLVPGSKQVENQIAEEGLREIFEEAGFEVRQPGCSACLGMNDDKVPPGEYCVSTSNRNFEGRQGPGSRTLLASPLTAAASAVMGVITDVRNIL